MPCGRPDLILEPQTGFQIKPEPSMTHDETMNHHFDLYLALLILMAGLAIVLLG